MGRKKIRAKESCSKPATLAQLRARRIDVWAWCNACSHHAVLPLTLLLRRFGPEMPMPALRHELRCGDCGSTNVEARPHWRGLGVIARHD